MSRNSLSQMTPAESPSPKLPGTRPQGAGNEREAAAHVQEMFTRIAPRYDFLNHLLSFSFDRVWRRRTAQRFQNILCRPEARVLDVCCGTGDLVLTLDHARARLLNCEKTEPLPLIGSDFVLPMLQRAHIKAAREQRHTLFIAADAMNLPYADATFDLVTSAFGFRNLANYEAGLREFARVLKPGGELGILDFSEPRAGAVAALFRFYFQRILPRVGGIISGSSDAYSYLPASVGKFPAPEELAGLMQHCGFIETQYEAWNFGSVVLHRARRRGS